MIQMQVNSFLSGSLSTRPRFDRDADGDSEMGCILMLCERGLLTKVRLHFCI